MTQKKTVKKKVIKTKTIQPKPTKSKTVKNKTAQVGKSVAKKVTKKKIIQKSVKGNKGNKEIKQIIKETKEIKDKKATKKAITKMALKIEKRPERKEPATTNSADRNIAAKKNTENKASFKKSSSFSKEKTKKANDSLDNEKIKKVSMIETDTDDEDDDEFHSFPTSSYLSLERQGKEHLKIKESIMDEFKGENHHYGIDIDFSSLFNSLSLQDYYPDGLDCLSSNCDNPVTTLGHCRYHYVKDWHQIIKKRELINERKLQYYLDELFKRYPLKFIEGMSGDFIDEKTFFSVLKQMNIEDNEPFEDSYESDDDDQDVAFEATKSTSLDKTIFEED